MARSRTAKPRKTNQSLTGSGWLKPLLWQISPEEAADALKIPVERIVKVHHKRHQVIMVYLNEQGQKCSSFFSYRLFARWQKETIEAILSCSILQTLEPLEEIVQYEIEHFHYPVEIANAIWGALLDHITRLTVDARFQKEAA